MSVAPDARSVAAGRAAAGVALAAIPGSDRCDIFPSPDTDSALAVDAVGTLCSGAAAADGAGDRGIWAATGADPVPAGDGAAFAITCEAAIGGALGATGVSETGFDASAVGALGEASTAA